LLALLILIKDLIMDDTDSNLLWFVHVSDIHLSKFPENKFRVDRFKQFASSVPKYINPMFFIATGDLTDAKSQLRIHSEQYLEEWEQYNSILKENGLLTPGYFYDVKGNHDCFNVPLNSQKNYYSNYSSSKLASYNFVKTTSFGKYSFVAIDACPKPGASRPFNFFGYLDSKEMDQLSTALHSFKDENHNHTIVFGHYPLLTMSSSSSSDGESFSALSRMFSVYLCGHLHSFLGKIHKLYARHIEGFLELEVADLGWTQLYRVMAIDHDLISFTDVQLNEWPVVLVTNPKDARFLISGKEPFDRINMSSHIRILAFSPHEIDIDRFEIEIDGKKHLNPVKKALHFSKDISLEDVPLYVSKWNPEEYSQGLHTIRVKISDSKGNVKEIEYQFSLDGSTIGLYGFGGLFLSLNFGLLVGIAFYSFHLMILLGFLLLPKAWVYYSTRKGSYRIWRKEKIELLVSTSHVYPSVFGLFLNPMQFFKGFYTANQIRFSELVQHNKVFYPLVIYGVYVLYCPWFIGKFIRGEEGTYGLFYLSGLYINGKLIPSMEPMWFAVFDIIFIYFPVVIFLSYKFCPVPEATHQLNAPMKWYSFRPLAFWRLVTILGLFNLFKTARDLWIWYEAVAFWISPAKLWWGIICLWMCFRLSAPGKIKY